MATLGKSITAGSSYDYIDVYYRYTAGTNGHYVYVYAEYRKTAGSVSFTAKSDTYININGSRAITGCLEQKHGAGTYPYMSEQRVWVGHNAAKTITISCHVYGLNSSYSGTYVDASFDITLPYVAPPYSKMGAPTVKIDSTSAKRGTGSVKVSWTAGSLGGASVTSYVVAYGKTSSPTETWYTGTNTTKTFTMPATVSVGTTYYFRAYQTSSAGSSYNSGWSSTVYVTATNNKPTISISSSSPSSKIIPYNSGLGGSGSFVFSYGDSAGTGSVSISVTPGWSRNGTTVSRLVSGEQGATDSCTVTVSDGYESNSASITFTINTVPSVTDASFTTTNYSGVLPDEDTTALVKSFKLSQITTSKSVTGYYLYYRILDSEHTPGSGIQINSSYESSNVEHNCKDITGLSTNNIWFQLGVQAYDGYDSSSVFWKDPIYFIPKNINNIIASTISWGAAGQVINDSNVLKINKNFTITWTNPVVDSGRTTLTSCMCLVKIGSGDYSTRIAASTTASGARATSEIPSLDSYRGQTIQFKIVIQDEYGNTYESSPSSTFHIIQLPTLTQTELTSNKNLFEPYAGITGFKLILSTAGISYTDSYVYEYSYYCPSQGVSISVGEEDDVHEANFEHNVNGTTFANNLKTSTGMATSENYWNSIYTDGYFRVRIVDAFQNKTDYIATVAVTVDYQIAPTISYATIKVAYDQSATTYDDSMATIDTSHNRVITNEKAVAFVSADDMNGVGETKDSLTYRYYYASGSSPSSFGSWNLISTIVARNTNEQRMAFTFPSANSLTYYKFRITVTDSTNKQVIYNFPNVLILAPTPAPIINNFTGEYNPSLQIASLSFTMPYSTVPDWAINRCCPSTYWSTTPILEELYNSFNGIDYILNKTFTGTSVSTSQSSNTYYKIRLTYNIGLNAGSPKTLITNSEVVLIYVNSPLVSYREGYMAINRSLKPTERNDLVLQISTQSSDRDMIIIGESDSNGYIQLQDQANYSVLGHFLVDAGTY